MSEDSLTVSSTLTTNNTPNNSSDEESTFITTLTPKMQRFVHLYMTGQYTIPKLAQLLELHPNTLWNWLKREDVQTVIQDMQQSTHDVVGIQLRALTLKAVNKLNALIDSPIDGVAYQAVRDVLDRSGHKPEQKIKVDKTVITFEQRLQQLADSTIVDIEGELIADD